MQSRNAMEYTADLGTLKQAVGMLQKRLKLAPGPQRKHVVTFLDTFDWALSRVGLRLSQSGDTLELSAQPPGRILVRSTGDAAHRLAPDLPAPLRGKLSAAMGLRALLPVATVRSTEVVLVARNAEEKMVARLVVARLALGAGNGTAASSRRSGGLRLTVVPLRGYDKEARRLAAEVSGIPGVEPAEGSVFRDAVEASGRSVGDYTGKLALKITRTQPAYEAARQIYGSQLDTMSVNASGVIADLDTEFLHDFRVAVRRTRSALKELPGILLAPTEERFRREFKWLGDVTTPTRDLDVY
ncbi:MAG: CHAD domain-containing protein, partial [Frankiaceae bacterium]